MTKYFETEEKMSIFDAAIAYEQKGLFDDALDAYEEALDLSPDDINIQQNYDLFMEIYDRLSEIDR